MVLPFYIFFFIFFANTDFVAFKIPWHIDSEITLKLYNKALDPMLHELYWET